MKISDLKEGSTVDEIVLKITGKEEPRAVKGGSLYVCNATGEDDTGKITITLWNDDIDKVKVGETIKITKGWCQSYNNVLQISSGKFGTIEVVKKEEE